MSKESHTDDLRSGDAFRDTIVPRADAAVHQCPMWFGWAVMDAFVAGAEYTREKAYAALCPHCADNSPFVIAEGWMPDMFHDWKDGGPGGRVKCAAFDLRKSLQPIT